MITVDVRLDRFKDAATKLVAIGGGAELRMQAKLLVQEAMRWTPPFKRGAAGSQSRGEQSKKIGERAVSIEYRRAVEPMFSWMWRDPRIREALDRARSKNKPDIVSKVLKNAAKVNGANGVEWRQAKSVHIAHGMARHGRRRKVTKKHPFWTWDTSEWLRYRDVLKNRVGRMRASWVKAGQQLGAKMPRYVTRHGQINGAIKDASNDKVSPSVSMTSYAPGIADPELMRLFMYALNGRAKAMASRYKYLVRDAAKKLGMR